MIVSNNCIDSVIVGAVAVAFVQSTSLTFETIEDSREEERERESGSHNEQVWG